MHHPFSLQTAAALEEQGIPFVMVTVVNKKGHGPASMQTSMLVTSDGLYAGTVGGGVLEKLAVEEARRILRHPVPMLKTYILDRQQTAELPAVKTGMICGGELTLFFAPYTAGTACILCGAGHVNRALAHHLLPLGYRITVIDAREEILSDFPFDVHKVGAEPFRRIPETGINQRTAVIIATHSHETDYLTLKAVLESDSAPGYCGVLASKSKQEQFQSRLQQEIPEIFQKKNTFLHMPCGLQTGGSLPHDIAVSITAQLQQWRWNKADS